MINSSFLSLSSCLFSVLLPFELNVINSIHDLFFPIYTILGRVEILNYTINMVYYLCQRFIIYVGFTRINTVYLP